MLSEEFSWCTNEQARQKQLRIKRKNSKCKHSCDIFFTVISVTIFKTLKLQIETRNFKWLNGSRNWNHPTHFMGSVVLVLNKSVMSFYIRGHLKSLNILSTVNIIVFIYIVVGGWYPFLLN